jgi:uncharacterized YigZ family protein
MPQTISSPAHSELVIRKSRFIGCVQPVANRVDAQQIVAELWARHPDATHVCWALMAGGHSAAVDDGEPSGTAGRPMLEVLRHQDLEGVLATVVRYYGGIQLGAGGLVRAYTDSVAKALLEAEKVPIIRLRALCCTVPYAQEGFLRREIEQAHANLLQVAHGEQVTFEFSLADTLANAFCTRLNEGCHGRIQWHEEE